MIPGIAPKIDIAFKKVFGSERFADLTAALSPRALYYRAKSYAEQLSAGLGPA